MGNAYYVYILASKRNGTLYVGMTNNLQRRIYEHKNNLIKGFTEKYNIHNLVYYEETNDVKVAIEREKQIKSWSRKKKLLLIDRNNSEWNDLSEKF
jgi:putative endonuclease